MGFFKKSEKAVSKDGGEPLSYKMEIEAMRERSKNIAWIVSGCCMLVVILMAMAIFAIMPLKEIQPYVIRVDNTTGYTDIITSVKHKNLTDIDAMDKYFISQYLMNREGYHYDTSKLEYRNTMLMTAPNIKDAYTPKFGPNGVVAQLGTGFEQNVKILSLQLLRQKGGDRIANVRFEVTTQQPGSQEVEGEEPAGTQTVRYTAYITYKYQPGLEMSESQRLVNPLGFMVTSYRLDKEVAQ